MSGTKAQTQALSLLSLWSVTIGMAEKGPAARQVGADLGPFPESAPTAATFAVRALSRVLTYFGVTCQSAQVSCTTLESDTHCKVPFTSTSARRTASECIESYEQRYEHRAEVPL